MTITPTPEPTAEPSVGVARDPAAERSRVLRTRHVRSVARLMEQRQDLRGVLPLADLVEESLRWTA